MMSALAIQQKDGQSLTEMTEQKHKGLPSSHATFYWGAEREEKKEVDKISAEYHEIYTKKYGDKRDLSNHCEEMSKGVSMSNLNALTNKYLKCCPRPSRACRGAIWGA